MRIATEQRSIQLPDGRLLGFESLGEPGGVPVFFLHGTPGSRLTITEEDEIVASLGVRLILPERPGYGISTPQPDRALVDWPADVEAVADHLGVDTFAVAGESGGGPHALACAYRLPQRVTRTLLFGSPAPSNRKGALRGMSLGVRAGVLLGKYAPWLIRRMIESYPSAFRRDPERFVDAIRKQMAPPDQTLLERKSVRDSMIRDFREAYRQGSCGQVTDSKLVMSGRDWGFRLPDISVPVSLWHGDADTLVSNSMMTYLARQIPCCDVHLVEGAGHLLLESPDVIAQIRAVLCGPSP